MTESHSSKSETETSKLLSIGMFILGASTLVGYQAILAGVWFFNNFIPNTTGTSMLDPASVIASNQLGFVIFPLMLVFESFFGIWMKILAPLALQLIISGVFYLLLSKSLIAMHIYIMSFFVGITQNMIQNGVFGWVGTMPIKVLLVTFVGQTFIGVFISSVKLGVNSLSEDSLKFVIYTVSWEFVLIAAAVVFVLMSRLKETRKYFDSYDKLSSNDEKKTKKTFKEQLILTKDVIIKLKLWLLSIFVNMFTSFLIWPANLVNLIMHKKGGAFGDDLTGGFGAKFGATADYIIFSYNLADFFSRLVSLLNLKFIEQAFSTTGIGIWLVLRIVSLIILPCIGFVQNFTAQQIFVYAFNTIFGVINGFSINFIMTHGNLCKTLKDEEKQTAGHLMVTFLVFGIIIGAVTSPLYGKYIFAILGERMNSILELRVCSNLYPFNQERILIQYDTTIATTFDMYIRKTQETIRIFPTMVSVNGKLTGKISSKVSQLIKHEHEGLPVKIYFKFDIPEGIDPYSSDNNVESLVGDTNNENRGFLTEVFAFINSNFRLDGIALRTKIFILLLILYTNVRYSGNINLLIIICCVFWVTTFNVVHDKLSRFRDLVMEYIDKIDEMLKRKFFSHLNNEAENQETGTEAATVKERIGIFFEDIGIWIVGFFYSLNPMWSI